MCVCVCAWRRGGEEPTFIANQTGDAKKRTTKTHHISSCAVEGCEPVPGGWKAGGVAEDWVGGSTVVDKPTNGKNITTLEGNVTNTKCCTT